MENGKLSVREVHDQVIANHDWAYSTTKTMMDRMVRKELLAREKFHGVFLYRPLISRPTGFTRIVQFFADHVLELDYGEVVALFSSSKAPMSEEIRESETLLAHEKEARHDTS